MTANELINQLEYQEYDLLNKLYGIHRYWRMGDRRCYLFMNRRWWCNTHIINPGHSREEQIDQSEDYPFSILPKSIRESNDWQLYTYKELIDDAFAFPEGDAFW